jgi:hypothetical protein
MPRRGAPHIEELRLASGFTLQVTREIAAAYRNCLESLQRGSRFLLGAESRHLLVQLASEKGCTANTGFGAVQHLIAAGLVPQKLRREVERFGEPSLALPFWQTRAQVLATLDELLRFVFEGHGEVSELVHSLETFSGH